MSTLHPHKNLENLLRAFARFRQERPDFWLVMTGVRGFHAAAVESRIDELGLAGLGELTGWIERSELYDLFRRATAMIYPSTFEGFGLPVIEAMAAGFRWRARTSSRCIASSPEPRLSSRRTMSMRWSRRCVG